MTETVRASSGSAADLMSSMMKKELFAISNICLVDPKELQQLLAAHLNYLIGLEKAGALFASGPLFSADGKMTGDGLTIVRASSITEAEALAKSDPFVAAGLRRPDVKRWILNEGRIVVSVDLSNCRGTLP